MVMQKIYASVVLGLVHNPVDCQQKLEVIN